jgi:hypothetical protein
MHEGDKGGVAEFTCRKVLITCVRVIFDVRFAHLDTPPSPPPPIRRSLPPTHLLHAPLLKDLRLFTSKKVKTWRFHI